MKKNRLPLVTNMRYSWAVQEREYFITHLFPGIILVAIFLNGFIFFAGSSSFSEEQPSTPHGQRWHNSVLYTQPPLMWERAHIFGDMLRISSSTYLVCLFKNKWSNSLQQGVWGENNYITAQISLACNIRGRVTLFSLLNYPIAFWTLISCTCRTDPHFLCSNF